ncbi:hypothetical protein AZI87_06940 [Bdellovibrio bacteriovorus]|uniref:Outer membrane protein beta-barrel domain-containing protein n=1 Tax=Bdellovibrio bacteriovorus TaxID=959 RepID=A0A162GU43_BDEBC|nr:hypothetical protein [Bdellovibrio bacteriovorus]KYG68955.1 hypothetical protein AZI87_06940 [Bdellovibrio bacteriovorus]
MKLHLSLISKVCFVLSVLAGSLSFAQEEAAPTTPQDENVPLVEVEVVQDNLAPYKDRRETHGMYFGVDYEGLDLKNYISTLDNLSYGDLFGTDPIPLIRVSIDYKYNFALGALALGLDYGMGKIEDNRSGSDRSLEVTKYGIGLKFVADNFMAEPYVAPYLGLNIWQMGLSESSPTDSFSATTQMGFNYTIGFLLQLDWLDYQTAKQTTFNWGLENTFIDVYATQYAATSAEDDPDTTTDFLYGAGLRLEF